MTKVYIVSDGKYSDYEVLGVYSTRDNAQDAKKLFGAENDIADYALDDMPRRSPGKYLYEVIMNRVGDSTTNTTCPEGYEGKLLVEFSDRKWEFNREFPPIVRDDGSFTKTPDVVFTIWASDDTHAIKIANEMRVQLLASGKWPYVESGDIS